MALSRTKCEGHAEFCTAVFSVQFGIELNASIFFKKTGVKLPNHFLLGLWSKTDNFQVQCWAKILSSTTGFDWQINLKFLFHNRNEACKNNHWVLKPKSMVSSLYHSLHQGHLNTLQNHIISIIAPFLQHYSNSLSLICFASSSLTTMY